MKNDGQLILKNYYPFGSVMSWQQTAGTVQGRSHSYSQYRYGFNNQEKDSELGDYYSFEYRMHDARLGRFLSIDPLTFNYPYYTPYQFGACNPIISVDIEGLESGNDKNPTTYTVSDGDCPSAIAEKFGLTPIQLLSLNAYTRHNDGTLIFNNWEGRAFEHWTSRYWAQDNMANWVIHKGDVLNVDGSKFIDPEKERRVLLLPISKGLNKPELLGIDIEMNFRIKFDGTYLKPFEGINSFGHSFATNSCGPFQLLEWYNDGAGPTNMVFGPNLMWTQNLVNYSQVEKGRSYYYQKYKNQQVTRSSEVTDYTIKWGVTDVLTDGLNLWRHYPGSCELTIFTSIDCKHLIFVIANSTNRWSGDYHPSVDKNTYNVSRPYSFKYYEDEGRVQKSSTLQIFIWKEEIDFNRLK